MQKRSFLEVEYEGEVGTGLGPTLEFYDLVSKELRQLPLWATTDDHSLFPAPSEGREEKVYFELMGQLISKGICDSRLVDLPFSPLFYELVLGKIPTLADIGRINLALYKTLEDIKSVVLRKRKIESSSQLDTETKVR